MRRIENLKTPMGANPRKKNRVTLIDSKIQGRLAKIQGALLLLLLPTHL